MRHLTSRKRLKGSGAKAGGRSYNHASFPIIKSSSVTSVLLPPCSVTFQREQGIVRLSSGFQWREFEGDDQRQYLHQEFVYENVMYSVQRGLPWSAVAQIANLCKELLPELRGESWLLRTCFTKRLCFTYLIYI